jgi:hypothetical protein
MDRFPPSLRYKLRLLFKSPEFTNTAVLILGQEWTSRERTQRTQKRPRMDPPSPAKRQMKPETEGYGGQAANGREDKPQMNADLRG